MSNRFCVNFAAMLAMVLACSTASFAELSGMKDSEAAPVEEKSEGLKAFIGIGGGNAMVADDGVVFASLRIGLELMPQVSVGAWASFLLSDVRNYNVREKQMVDYKAFGAFAELFPFRYNKFAISVPIAVGGGVVNSIDDGDESFAPEDYFFTGEMAVHFNYRVTKMLEVSIGGGYRMFAGIEENNLENMDFCTPFGELRFTIKE